MEIIFFVEQKRLANNQSDFQHMFGGSKPAFWSDSSSCISAVDLLIKKSKHANDDWFVGIFFLFFLSTWLANYSQTRNLILQTKNNCLLANKNYFFLFQKINFELKIIKDIFYNQFDQKRV